MTALAGVLGELRRTIVSGELRPGERIMQDVLAEQLQVSRVPVREALHILQGEGKLRHIPNHGYYVASLSPQDLQELVDARGLLEDEAIRQGLSKITVAHISRLEVLLVEMREATARGRPDVLQQANREFHSVLTSPSGLVHFQRLIDTLWDAIGPYHQLYFVDTQFHPVAHDEHAAIVEAVRSRDTESLLTMLRAHRLQAIEATIAKLER